MLTARTLRCVGVCTTLGGSRCSRSARPQRCSRSRPCSPSPSRPQAPDGRRAAPPRPQARSDRRPDRQAGEQAGAEGQLPRRPRRQADQIAVRVRARRGRAQLGARNTQPAPRGMADRRVARREGPPDRLLALEPARQHQARTARPPRSAAVEDRARLQAAQRRAGPRPLPRPLLARLAPPHRPVTVAHRFLTLERLSPPAPRPASHSHRRCRTSNPSSAVGTAAAAPATSPSTSTSSSSSPTVSNKALLVCRVVNSFAV